MKKILTQLNDDEHKRAFQYASTAFSEYSFVQAFSKLKTVLENETHRELLLKDGDLSLKEQKIQFKPLIYQPIEEAMIKFEELYSKYRKLEQQTKINDINLLLNQDFGKTKEVMDPFEISKSLYIFELLNEGGTENV